VFFPCFYRLQLSSQLAGHNTAGVMPYVSKTTLVKSSQVIDTSSTMDWHEE